MSRKKISTTIYVTPEQNDRLKVLHERTKVPVAVYIREGIDLVLRQYAHMLPGQLALSSSSTPRDLFREGAPEAPPTNGTAATPPRGQHHAEDATPAMTPAAGAGAGAGAPSLNASSAAAAAAKK